MKKAYWICYILSLCFCVIGIVFRNWLNILDIIFVLLGVALLLFAFMQHCISKAQRCPNCNAIIYSGHIRTIARQKNGVVPCENCGNLVCVNHSHRK